MDNDMGEDDKSAEWLLPTHSSATNDIFGDPQKSPRIGDEHQAKIPNLMKENVKNQLEFALSIPVMWVLNQHKKNNEKAMESQKNANVKKVNCSEKSKGKFDNYLLPAPGTLGESWSIIEHESFLLGLYIFGKNLRAVKKFVGNKEMENVLSYYYGEFYGSDDYHKWSKYRKRRKKRSKRSILGERIFTGWREEVLLSRLFSSVTDECKSSLTKASKMFEEGKLSFEEYVFTIKDKVGINLLLEAIAIGKEKQDLTVMAMDPLATNNRLELPSGKTYSTLTTQEIVKILKSDFRLSKTRSNDLFWEAIWPRLLARGWHSEQPRNYIFQKSKYSLVFLVPGIEKFSRRELEKGSQYFDSVTDVLSKVASEPELLELEPDHTKPSEPQCNQDPLKFMIVDTSLVCKGEGLVKLRNLRKFPVIESHEYVNQSSHDVFDSSECKKMDLCTNGQSRKTTNNGERKRCESYRKTKSFQEKPTLGDDKNEIFKEPCSFQEKPTLGDEKNEIFKEPCSEKNNGERKRCESYRKTKSFQEKPTLGDDKNEIFKEPCSEKKRPRIMIDLNLPQMGPDSDSEEPSVLPETTSKQPELLTSTNGQSQRQSTRNRPLTTKALEALANGLLSPKKKRKSAEERTPRRVRPKTALVSSYVGDV